MKKPNSSAEREVRSRRRRAAVERALTHACAGVALSYTLRIASFARSWLEVPLLPAAPLVPLPLLSIVVPARDEERSIERCVRSLLAQRWLTFEIIVVDDRSSDRTLAILEGLAREDARVRVVCGAELPSGWVGKPWALAQGARFAGGEWLLFTDADSVHAPGGAASALWFATHARIDALSIATHQELKTFWERATLPSILGTILFIAGPLGDINDPAKPARALANGQYIMVSRTAYDALGGHEALRNEIAEDLAFARRIKADGRFRFILADGHRIASVRMYRSLGEIWTGFTKNVFLGARGNLPALGGGAAFLAMISVVPPVLAARALHRRRYAQAVEALASTLAVIGAASWAMRRAALSPLFALMQPLGTAFFGAIVINSTFGILSGRGVEWRGRRYSGRPQERPDLTRRG